MGAVFSRSFPFLTPPPSPTTTTTTRSASQRDDERESTAAQPIGTEPFRTATTPEYRCRKRLVRSYHGNPRFLQMHLQERRLHPEHADFGPKSQNFCTFFFFYLEASDALLDPAVTPVYGARLRKTWPDELAVKDLGTIRSTYVLNTRTKWTNIKTSLCTDDTIQTRITSVFDHNFSFRIK